MRTAINQIILTLMNKNYKLDEGGQTLGTIMGGLQFIHRKLYPYSDMAPERITDFIVYQLYRKRQCMYRFTAIDLFSKFAVQKFHDQFLGQNARPGMNYYIDQWLGDAGITRASLTKIIEGEKPNKLQRYIYMASEEVIKKRFLNTANGYFLCQQSTTGFAPRSETCCVCQYRDKCLETTRLKYPELIRLRLQDKDYDKEK